MRRGLAAQSTCEVFNVGARDCDFGECRNFDLHFARDVFDKLAIFDRCAVLAWLRLLAARLPRRCWPRDARATRGWSWRARPLLRRNGTSRGACGRLRAWAVAGLLRHWRHVTLRHRTLWLSLVREWILLAWCRLCGVVWTPSLCWPRGCRVVCGERRRRTHWARLRGRLLCRCGFGGRPRIWCRRWGGLGFFCDGGCGRGRRRRCVWFAVDGWPLRVDFRDFF